MENNKMKIGETLIRKIPVNDDFYILIIPMLDDHEDDGQVWFDFWMFKYGYGIASYMFGCGCCCINEATQIALEAGSEYIDDEIFNIE